MLLVVSLVLSVMVAALAVSHRELSAKVQDLHVVVSLASQRSAKETNAEQSPRNVSSIPAPGERPPDAPLQQQHNKRAAPMEDAVDRASAAATAPTVIYHAFRLSSTLSTNVTRIPEDHGSSLPGFETSERMDEVLTYDVCCRMGETLTCARGVELDSTAPTFSARLKRDHASRYLALQVSAPSLFAGKTCWLRYELTGSKPVGSV